MKSNYKPIGNYIKKIEHRNKDLKVTRLLGLSMTKEFRETTSNIVGTDMSVYKVMSKYQFACDFMSPIRVNKLPVVLKLDDEPNLVSPAYPVFEIKDRNELDPEYLMMWFRRPEFDRYATFKCDAAIRGGYEWKELCETLIPVPSIDKQKEIIKEYNIIQDRIALNQQLIQRLEETAKTLYKQWFVDFEFPDKSGTPYKSSGGEMVFNEELEKEIPKGWELKPLKSICSKIGSGSTPKGGKESYHKTGTSLVRSMNVHDFIFNFEELAFIDDNQAKALEGVSLNKNDILLNITGVSVARCCIVPEFVLPARVNQHVMIIRPKSEYHLANYLLCFFCYSDNKARLLGISQSGSTREAITKEEVNGFMVIVPNELTVKKFDAHMSKVFRMIEIEVLNNNKLNELRSLLLSKIATIEN